MGQDRLEVVEISVSEFTAVANTLADTVHDPGLRLEDRPADQPR
jgi:hypothetical protein